MTKGARASTRDARLREHDLVTGRNSCHPRQPRDERARRAREPPSASTANRADGQREFRPRARRYPGPHRHRSRLRLASPPRPIAGSVQHTSPRLSENLGREPFDPTDDRGSFALLSASTSGFFRTSAQVATIRWPNAMDFDGRPLPPLPQLSAIISGFSCYHSVHGSCRELSDAMRRAVLDEVAEGAREYLRLSSGKHRTLRYKAVESYGLECRRFSQEISLRGVLCLRSDAERSWRSRRVPGRSAVHEQGTPGSLPKSHAAYPRRLGRHRHHQHCRAGCRRPMTLATDGRVHLPLRLSGVPGFRCFRRY
jgi:hypothetical protein